MKSIIISIDHSLLKLFILREYANYKRNIFEFSRVISSIPSSNDKRVISSIPSSNDKRVISSIPSSNDKRVISSIPSSNDKRVISSIPSSNDKRVISSIPSSNDKGSKIVFILFVALFQDLRSTKFVSYLFQDFLQLLI